MLPVVAGLRRTRQLVALYTVPMAAVAVAPSLIGLTGGFYLAVAAGLSLLFAVLALDVLRNRATEPAGMAPERRLFAFSIFYLFALFAALVVDRLL